MLTRIIKTGFIGLSVAGLALPVFAQCPNQRPNGYCPETTLRPGEVPIWQSQFKASHNSWGKSETVSEQIDNFNNWMVEFDLYYYAGLLRVSRFNCDFEDLSYAPDFSAAVAGVHAAQTDSQRVTFIYMRPGSNANWAGAYWCFGNFAAFSTTQAFPLIEEYLVDVISPDQFYTHADFRDIDNYTWPSAQELIRRGQYYVAIVGEFYDSLQGPAAGEDEDFFFGAFSGDPDWGNPGNRVLAQRDGGCDLGGTPAPWTPNPRFLMRGYPAAACSGSCTLQDGGYWDDGVNQGYNFISTDCINDDNCVDPGVHSPMPYYVVNSGTYDHNWGTLSYPRVGTQGLYNATRRVSPMVDIRIEPGTYILNNLPQFILDQRTIRRPMVLKNRNGAGDVVIR